MSSQHKSNLLTGVIATHFAGMMTLLNQSAFRSNNVYYGTDVNLLYFLFFVCDIPFFFILWSIIYRPHLEVNNRIVVLFWVFQTNIVLLPTSGVGPGFFIASILEIILLVWPKRYIPITGDEIEIDEKLENITRIKCTNCGAIYAYNLDAAENGKVTCQNCGKSFRVQEAIAQSL